MAKKKPQNGVDMPSKLPQLSDETLSSLTSKIESKLQTSKIPKARKSAPSKKSKATDSRPLSANSKTGDDGRGKKRTRDGVVIQSSNSNFETSMTTSSDHARDALRAEIIALGGTDEDLALVADLESASEYEDEPQIVSTSKLRKSNKSDRLRDDIAKMLNEMGADQSRDTMTIPDEDVSDVNTSEEESEDTDTERAQVVEPFNGDSVLPSGLDLAPESNWHEISLPDLQPAEVGSSRVSKSVLDRVHEYAKGLLDAENDSFRSQQSFASSSQRFYATVINSGTLSDKISALTLAIQESPVHNVKALENLINLAGKRSRAQAMDVLRALKDLFAQGSLLPSDRRLRAFSSQPALLATFHDTTSWSTEETLPNGLTRRHLILWAFEDWLKDSYFQILRILETWCNDELEFSKARALSYVFELLKEKPEQESNLLKLLVNKLGDRTKKIASRASYLLLQLQLAHPLMKSTIVSAIENDLLWRSGQTLHAQYYAVVTLNQTALSAKAEHVASKLLEIYFNLFVSLLKPDGHASVSSQSVSATKPPLARHQAGKISLQDDDLREKLTSAILTGINRAYPYVTSARNSVTDHMDTLFRITHSANFNTSIQAMMLIQQLTFANQLSSDRFYRTLYESLLDPRLVASSKQSLYLNLLFKSLKSDLSIVRVKAFTKRLLQIVSLHQPSFVIGVFHLVKELEVTFPSLKGLMDEAEEHEAEDEHFLDVDADESNEKAQKKSDTLPSEQTFYDGKKRDPEHSNAEQSCLWELMAYTIHYHPSVSVGAESLLHHRILGGKADLDLYTLIHFLDKFVYRNPKAASSTSLRGSSIMQPSMAADGSLQLLSKDPQRQLSVNNESFWKRKAEDVAADEVFFHQYFSTIGKDKASHPRTRVENESEEGDEEDAIWKAITESRPDVEGDENSSVDELDMDNLESEFDSGDEDMLNDSDDDDTSDRASLLQQDDSDVELVGFDDASNAAALEMEARIPGRQSKSEKSERLGSLRDRKRKLKGLPTFASISEYAAMLEDDDGEDVGLA